MGLAEAPTGLQANTDVVQTSMAEKQAQATANLACARGVQRHVGAEYVGSFERSDITELLSPTDTLLCANACAISTCMTLNEVDLWLIKLIGLIGSNVQREGND